MNSIQPQLWIERAGKAVEFYQQAFGVAVQHLVGEGDEIVAQLAAGDAVFWVATADPELNRHSPATNGGATARFLLVVEDPEHVVDAAAAAGASILSPVHDEHGWRLGRIVDPFGHEWEIGHPIGSWPPVKG